MHVEIRLGRAGEQALDGLLDLPAVDQRVPGGRRS
jgi:hypothetical protein